MKRSILFLLPLIARSNYVLAEENDPFSNNNTSMWLTLLQLIFSLGVVIGLIYLLFRFLSKKTGIYRNSFFKHFGGVPLGQNKSVQVIEIGNKIYLIGVGENIQLIDKIEDIDEILAIKESLENDSSQEIPFLSNIKAFKPDAFLEKLKNLVKFRKPKNSFKQGDFEQILTQKMNQLQEKRNKTIGQMLDEENEEILGKERDHHE